MVRGVDVDAQRDCAIQLTSRHYGPCDLDVLVACSVEALLVSLSESGSIQPHFVGQQRGRYGLCSRWNRPTPDRNTHGATSKERSVIQPCHLAGPRPGRPNTLVSRRERVSA